MGVLLEQELLELTRDDALDDIAESVLAVLSDLDSAELYSDDNVGRNSFSAAITR